MAKFLEHLKYDIAILESNCLVMENWHSLQTREPFWRLYWTDCAGAFMKEHGVEIEMQPDTFYLIPANTYFETALRNSFTLLYVHFTIGAPFDCLKSKVYSFPIDDCILSIIKKMRSFIKASNLCLTQLMLMSYSLVYCSLSKFKPVDFDKKKPRDNRIEETVELLNQVISSLMSNDELAERAGMSVNAFIRLFKKEIGISPQYYSRKKRIEKARLALQFSDENIASIAENTGFLNRYHFTRVFKEYIGQSPAEFRKTHKDH